MRIKAYLKKKINRLRVFALAILAICALPFFALADGGRECVVDPATGVLVPPNGSGACFGDSGFSLSIFDFADGDFVFAANGPDINQWGRLNPNGKGFFHTSGKKEVFAVYCSAATIQAGECFPGSPEPFEGVGKLTLNSNLTEDLFFTCPLTARLKATGYDGYGNAVDFTAALTLVPDADFGCRATVERIEATPVVD